MSPTRSLATTGKEGLFHYGLSMDRGGTASELGHVEGPHFRGWSPCGPVDADEDLAFLAFAFHLDDQVNGKLTIAGVNGAHYTGDFAFSNRVCTSYWHVKLDGLKFNGAAVKTIPDAIVDSGAAEPTMDVKFMDACQVCRPPSFGGLVTCYPRCLVFQYTGCLPKQCVSWSEALWDFEYARRPMLPSRGSVVPAKFSACGFHP